MLHTENIEVFNFKGAFRGMRNPMASWHRSDTVFDSASGALVTLGENDRKLALTLVASGSDHRKFIRQILVSMDIIAPDYWWKEMDTYKVGTVANSTSTMHKLTSKPLTMEDFSWDQPTPYRQQLLVHLNELIDSYKKLTQNDETERAKKIWRELIQDLPMSFHYTRTWTSNYESLRHIYHARKSHKLSEWHDFCRALETLPFSELITIQ